MRGDEAMKKFETIDVAREIVELVNLPTTKVEQLSAVLTKDPILMKDILHRANTLVDSSKERISDLNLAIVLLGFDVLKKTIASTIIHNSLRKIVIALSEYDSFWNHSLHVGILSHTLAGEINQCDSSDAFAAGLLHDIGHIVNLLDIQLPAQENLCSDQRSSNSDHANVGASLARQWNLPENIIEAIEYHHKPLSATLEPKLAALVHIADVVSDRLGSHQFPEEEVLTYDKRACEILQISNEILLNPDQSKFFKKLEETYHQPDGVDFMTNLRTTMLDAVSSLAEEERIVLALRYYDGLSFSEIGKLCGYNASTAEQHHTNALVRLKSLLLPGHPIGEKKP